MSTEILCYSIFEALAPATFDCIPIISMWEPPSRNIIRENFWPILTAMRIFGVIKILQHTVNIYMLCNEVNNIEHKYYVCDLQ